MTTQVDTQDPMEVLVQAERLILRDDATADDVRKAIAMVDALQRPDFSSAIRRTLKHHADHGAPEE
jgi:hypothetical protein